MNLRLTPAITIMAMLMMGIALIHMAPHQAEAQSNDCYPLNLGAEIIQGAPVLTWDAPTNCTPASYDVWRKAKVNGSWIEKLSIHATSIKGTTYTDTSAEAGNLYRYRVQVDGSNRRSGYVDIQVPQERVTRDTHDDPTPPDPDPPTCDGVWCATLTPQNLGDGGSWGCGSSTAEKCSNVDNLSENEFTYAGVDYAVNGVRVRSNGRLELWINLDLNMDSRHLVLHVDSESFAFQSADAKGTNNRQWNNTALDWSSGAEISLRLAEPINIDPVFEEGTDTSRTFNETIDSNVVNTATNIGMPVTATDPNGDPLTYSLGGTNAGTFEIDDTNGQIKTKVGENYNYETKQSYSVTVIAEDGKEGTASINVALNVVDLNEAPLPPQFDLLALEYNSGVRVSIRDECDPATSITECAEYYQIETKKTTDQYWRRDSTIRPPGWPDNMSRGHQDSVDRYTPDIYTFNNEPLDTDVIYQFRVRGVRRGQHGEWSMTKTKRTIEEEALPDPVIRLSFNEFETEYDSNGNVVPINRVDQIETLEGFDQTITIKAKCDPCHGLVHDITVPLHYTYSHPDIGEATVFQDRVTIYPAEEGTVKTVSLDWKPESNRVDLQGNQSVQIRFGKITFVDTTTTRLHNRDRRQRRRRRSLRGRTRGK